MSEPKQNNPDSNLPPFSISSILHFAWGMTMGLSQTEHQRYLAEVFKDKFSKLWEKYDKDPKAISFLNEIAFYLSASERSYGFERDVYFSYIDGLNDMKATKIDYYTSLANITSTNADGIYSRVISFLGVGSFGGLASLLGHNGDAFFPVFLIAGAGGFGLITFILKKKSSDKIEETIEDFEKKIHQYWTDILRPSLIERYLRLADDLRKVYKEYYIKNKEEEDKLLPSREELKNEIIDMIPFNWIYDYHEAKQLVDSKEGSS